MMSPSACVSNMITEYCDIFFSDIRSCKENSLSLSSLSLFLAESCKSRKAEIKKMQLSLNLHSIQKFNNYTLVHDSRL